MSITTVLALWLGLVSQPVPVQGTCLHIYNQYWDQYCDPDANIRAALIKESQNPGLGAQ